MKMLSNYSGEESIIINGKIMKPMGEILKDDKLMEELQKDQFGAIGEIMQKHSKAVFDIVSTVSDGEINGGNVGAYFMSIFTEYCKGFGENSFFNSAATTE